MVYISIRELEDGTIIEYVLCDDCSSIPEGEEIDKDYGTIGSTPCEICGCWNGECE